MATPPDPGPLPGYSPVTEEGGAAAAARERAGVAVAPAPEVCSLLRWAAATLVARTAVEIGSAGGVSGLWLLDGMDERGVLTSIEADDHLHGLATTAYEEAGVGSRVRSILGEPSEVLERLTDDGYVLCVIQHGRALDHLDEALRLLKPGGVLLVRNLGTDGSGEELAATLAEDDRIATAVLTEDGGLLLATLLDDFGAPQDE